MKAPEERKNELMDIALEFFFTKGFENTTIGDIVKKAGVAQGLFYYYFNSKNDILDAAINRYIDKLIKSLEDIKLEIDLNPLKI
jgi:AcrR family transcriptional regulator